MTTIATTITLPVSRHEDEDEDGGAPEAKVDQTPHVEALDKDGLPLVDANKPNDGQDEREQAEGDIHTSCQLHPSENQ